MYTFNFIFAPKLASVDPRQVYSVPLGIVSELNIRKESRKNECPFGKCCSSRCKNIIFENAPPNFLKFVTFSEFIVRQNRVKLKVSRKVRRFWNKKKSRKTEIRVSRTRVKRGMPVLCLYIYTHTVRPGEPSRECERNENPSSIIYSAMPGGPS